MKTEITLENKAKFFAQYWKQEVLSVPNTDMVFGNISQRWEGNVYTFEEQHLKLKHLSSITDEDAEFIASLEGLDHIAANEIKNLIISNDKYWMQYFDNDVSVFIQVIDYLRSKGYALPWMGLSVEEMVEAGWTKLNEQ